MKSWHSRMSGWLDTRIPPARQFRLNMRSIFIFPSKFGALFLALCLGLFLLGTNYQNNLMLLLCYFLISLFLLNLFVAYMNFARLQIQLGKTHNVFVGDQVQLPLWFNANKDKEAQVHGHLHVQFWRDAPALCIDLDQAHNPHNLGLTAESRGVLTLPRITFSNFYPIALFRCWTHLAFDHDVIVYPKPVPCAINLRESLSGNESGESARVQGYDDFDSLSPHRQGEPLHHVAWKQFAKGQGMLSKHFSSETSASGWLTLLPCSADELEKRLGQLTFQVIELGRKGETFGLDLGHQKLEPDNSKQHMEQCLRALALFTWPGSGKTHAQ